MEFKIYSRDDETIGWVKIDGNKGTVRWYNLETWWGDLCLEPKGSDEFTLYQDAEVYEEEGLELDLLNDIICLLNLSDDYAYL